MMMIQFADKVVTYETFINDVAARITSMLRNEDTRNLPPYISQRKAFELFGQGNVKRWRKQQKIEPRIRPGKVEYSTAELLKLQNTVQDYFD